MPWSGGQLLIFSRGASETAGVGGGSARPQVEKTSDVEQIGKQLSSEPGKWPKEALTMAARRRRSYSMGRSLGHSSQREAARDLVAAGEWGCCR